KKDGASERQKVPASVDQRVLGNKCTSKPGKRYSSCGNPAMVLGARSKRCFAADLPADLDRAEFRAEFRADSRPEFPALPRCAVFGADLCVYFRTDLLVLWRT